MKILVTGSAGFIGSALTKHLVLDRGEQVCSVDNLTYSGNISNLSSLHGNSNHQLEQLDICDSKKIRELVLEFHPDAIMHLAAESHVDRSIDDPSQFINTNINGTFNLLEAARELFASEVNLRFLHVSTDEVYGSLGAEGAFSESSPYQPNSPYSASKAASDHLARAWFETYGLPVLVSNCSNNYGPYQFPEKLIPLTILNAIGNKKIPLYGDGLQIRDWLYVEDHIRGLTAILQNGEPGRTYNIGGNCEKTNREIVHTILNAIAQQTNTDIDKLYNLVDYVKDRPGHDRRYAIDSSRIQNELNWSPDTSFESGIQKTVKWYLENMEWCNLAAKSYNGKRLGVIES